MQYSLVTLPNGQQILPGTSLNYKSHTLKLSASGTELEIDGEIVDKFYPVNIKDSSGSGNTTSIWIVKLPDNDGYLLIAPAMWQKYHKASITIDHTKAIMVMDETSRSGDPTPFY
ncbi:hypothetical protein N0V90_005583 [Kalmusia sp. IMI 367209]|nr:hypothetical protein N0V90_005583 [Kalmusia sp. IMI 367209]